MEGLSRAPGSQRGEKIPMIRIPIESDVYRDISGEIDKSTDVKDGGIQVAEVPEIIQVEASQVDPKEQTAELARQKVYDELDLSIKQLLVEAGAIGGSISGPEARALVQSIKEKVESTPFYDGVYLDQMKEKGKTFIDINIPIKLTTVEGKEAEFKVMLKVKNGEFKLQGDVLDPKGQYAEDLMNP